MKEKLVDFDEFADDYRNILTQSVKGLSGADGDYFSEYKILEISDELENSKILDFGCGDGNTAQFINKNIKNYEYCGIDISEKSIEQAKKRMIPDTLFFHYDGVKIPFEDSSFDVVFVACVFHHIDKTKHIDTLKEIYRVLKKDGKIIIFEHNPNNLFTLKTVHDCPFDVGVKLISSSKMLKNLRKSMFAVNKSSIHFTLFFPRKFFFTKLLKFEKKLWWCFLGAQYYCIGVKR